jgi:hypothetical protein
MDDSSYRNNYVIEIPQGYSRTEELRNFLKKHHNDTDGYDFEERPGVVTPKCFSALSPRSLVITEVDTGMQWGALPSNLDDVIRDFLAQ